MICKKCNNEMVPPGDEDLVWNCLDCDSLPNAEDYKTLSEMWGRLLYIRIKVPL